MPAAKPKADTGRIRDDIVALFKPDAWMKKAEIAEALGVSSDFLTFHLGKLIADKELIATGSTGNRAFALPDTAAPKTVTKPAKAETKTRKSETKVRNVETKTHKPETTVPKPDYIDQTISHLLYKIDAISKAIAALQSL